LKGPFFHTPSLPCYRFHTSQAVTRPSPPIGLLAIARS
jgi:hypothetical protein